LQFRQQTYRKKYENTVGKHRDDTLRDQIVA
jgi:hypothetical protein